MRTFTRVMLIALGAAVLLGGVLLALAAGAPKSIAITHPAPSATHTTDKQATEVGQALQQLTKHPERLVPSSLRSTVRTATAVPPGTVVRPDLTTWHATGPKSGTIQVALTSKIGVRTVYLVVVVEEDGTWRVLETEPLS